MKTALVYSFEAKKTSQVAKHVETAWGKGLVTIDAENTTAKDLAEYDLLIIGAATWFDGELPDYWDIMVPNIELQDFTGTKVAIFGLGNQKEYSENFVDAIGIMADLFESNGAKVIAYTSTEGYNYESSVAEKDGQFCGLALDIENQASLTKERVAAWVEQVKKEAK